MDLKEYYIEIPNKLFYTKNNDSISIYKTIKDYKIILVLSYLYTNTNRIGEAKFTLNDIIEECGMKPNNKKGKINDTFRNILIQLNKLHILQKDIDYSTLKPDKLIRTELNLFEKNDKLQNIEYSKLYYSIKEKILSYNAEKVDNTALLFYYCYLNSRIYKRNKDMDNVIAEGGRAECCYVDFERINKDTDLTDKTIAKYNDILVKLNLIRYDRAGCWYYRNDNNKVLKDSCNVYVLYNEYENIWKTNLKEGIKLYILNNEDTKVFTAIKDCKSNNKKINGKIGRIQYLEKMGKATPVQIKEKNEIIKLKEISKVKYEIQLLLDENSGKTLSEIYADKDNMKYSSYYFELEYDLELINNNGKLIIDYEYYKWVMVNYTKEKHSYFVKCIEKHKEKNINRNDFPSYNQWTEEDYSAPTTEELKTQLIDIHTEKEGNLIWGDNSKMKEEKVVNGNDFDNSFEVNPDWNVNQHDNEDTDLF